MTLYQMIALFCFHIVCCGIGLIGTIKVYKWRLRSKIVVFFLTGSVIFYCTAGYLVYNEFSWARILLAGGISGVVASLLVAWLMKELLVPITRINTCLDLLTTGDFSRYIGKIPSDELGEISKKLNMMISEMSALISTIKDSSKENLKMAEDLSVLSGDMSENAHNTAQRTSSVASSSEEMSMNTKSHGRGHGAGLHQRRHCGGGG